MKKTALLLISVFTLISCTQKIDSPLISETQISSVNKINESASILKSENIPDEIKKLTQKEAKEMSDKESKRRGVDFFNIPNNPVGMKISYADKSAYILNYIGTSENTVDVNVEMKAFYSEDSKIYSLNYSGPITNTEKFKVKKEKNTLKTTKDEKGITFELIQGLPPEHIINTFSDYAEGLKEVLKMIYRPQKSTISEEDVFIYAIKYNGEVKGFFFESHANKVILGERKYADMQLGVFITNENKILQNYVIVAFNPKAKLNQNPSYKFFDEKGFNFIQLGDL
ncbi:MAG: hypothetical protein AABZ74_06010 [Cyanobacteriota bacterium]